MTLSVAIHHRFEGFSLNVEFDAPPGLTAVFGRSGAGKTAVMRAVAGLFHPDQGRIAVGERVLCDTERGVNLAPHKRRIGTIFQDARLFPHLTVAQNLDYGRRFAPREVSAAERRRMIEMLGIGHLLMRRPAALSGGEAQRVAIGRALLSAPEIVLADEPLAALDEARKAEILPYFERLRDEVSVPILYVSHSPSEVARLATSVVAMENGQVIGHGHATEVLSNPDILPIGAQGAGSVIEAEVRVHHADGLTELSAGGVALYVPRLSHPIGARVRLRIAAQDVMLSRMQPAGISALNIVPGRITNLRESEDAGMLVSLATPAGTVLARITNRSAAALGFCEGMACFAVVKTVSLQGGLG